jgi:hypothetical protein
VIGWGCLPSATRSEVQRLAASLRAGYRSVASVCKPVHAGIVLCFEATASRSVPANVGDFDRNVGQRRETNCEADQLSSTFESASIKNDGFVRLVCHRVRGASDDSLSYVTTRVLCHSLSSRTDRPGRLD